MRCLNCGSEVSGENCEECGLAPGAAAAEFRRRLVNLTGIYLLGAIAFLPASQYYPPLELDAILIFVGVLFFLTLGVSVWLDVRARQQKEVEALKRVFRALIPLPWLLGGLVFLNGNLDRSAASNQASVVISKFSMPGWARSQRLVVRAWRAGRTLERIPVSPDDYERFRVGEEIEVDIREGLAGIPWVHTVARR